MSVEILAFTTSPYKKDDISLASLIPDKHHPNQDARFKLDVETDVDYSVASDLNFAAKVRNRSDVSFGASLSKIFSVGIERAENSELAVEAEESLTYELRQPAAAFEKLCEQEPVRKWLQTRQRLGKKTYFVIGYRTLVDAKVIRRERHSSGTAGRVAVPGGFAAGIELTPGAKLAAAGASKSDHGEVLQALGERIYAMCYRKIRLSFHVLKENETVLSGNRWKTTFTRRTSGPPEVVEATLEEEGSEAFDLETTTGASEGTERFAFLSPDES